MAVQAQFVFGGGGLAGCVLPCCGGGGLAEEQMQALLSAAASDLTSNGGAGAVPPSRKRGRDAEHEQYVSSSQSLSPATLRPIPGTHMHQAITGHQSPAGRLAESAMTSTSGRPASVAAALAQELRLHDAEIDALVRAECDRLRAGLEQARKRQCVTLARVAAAALAPALRSVEAELAAARRRAADLEELLRRAAAESQAWRGLARSNGAVAAGLRAAIDAVLLQGAGVGDGTGTGAARPGEEGFGESDDAQSCCFVEAAGAGAASMSFAEKWACRACGGSEASVLVLPCRHLCLCKGCDRRTDVCPVCADAKNAAIRIAKLTCLE